MREEPVQSYYPSARLRFIVRFEDFGASGTPKVPPLPPQLRRGKGKTSTASLELVERDGSYLLVSPGDDPAHIGSPQQQQASSDGLTHVVEGIIPSAASQKNLGMRTASTLSVTVPFAAFPFDPRVVRAVGVQYFLGCVSAEDYDRGISGAIRADATPSGGLPFHVVPDTWVDSAGRVRSNLRFEGWVDDWETSWPASDRPEVTLNCTDNTRLLLEQDAPPRLAVDPKVRLDRAIAEYLANFPQFRGLGVAYMPKIAAEKIPKLQAAFGPAAYHPQLGPTPNGGSPGKFKVWDYLTDVCGAVGHNIRMVGTTIVIQRPRTLYDARFAGRPDDPFRGRTLPSGLVLPRRLYVYGKNILEMATTRKFATYQPRNVEIRSYDPNRKTTIVVRFPDKKLRQKKLLPGEAADQPFIVRSIPGLRDEPTARVVAQSIYEAQGRNEFITRIQTKALGSFGGGNLDPDALDLLPGDSIDVEVDRSSTVDAASRSSVAALTEAMRTNAAEFLTSLGYSEELATAYSKVADSIGIPKTFRLRQFGTNWEIESGVSLDLECMNYLEARADVDLAPEEQITPADTIDAAVSGDSATSITVVDEVSL